MFPEPLFSGDQLTPSFENQGSIRIFEGQLDLTPSGVKLQVRKIMDKQQTTPKIPDKDSVGVRVMKCGVPCTHGASKMRYK